MESKKKQSPENNKGSWDLLEKRKQGKTSLRLQSYSLHVQSDVKDFASTKHKGLPEEKRSQEGKRDGKGCQIKRLFPTIGLKGGGWVQTGGKHDGKPCAKQPEQKTKPYCRDADDRASMVKTKETKGKKRKERSKSK